MSKNRFFAVVTSMALVIILVACVAPTSAPETVVETVVVTQEVVKTVEVPAEEAKITIWWWGEQNIEGYQAWLRESAHLYNLEHPNIVVEDVLQGDETVTAFTAAVAANQGPDIGTLWYGMYMMPDVWAGNMQPYNDYVSEEELSHWVARGFHTWDNKAWSFDQYISGHPIIYNKKMFAAAGLDPDTPPETYEEFLQACEALKQAGIVPMATGTKDGWMGNVMADAFAHQDLESVYDIMKAVVGELHFNDPEFTAYWERLYEMKQAGYFNDNATSIGTWDARLMFPAEEAAMGFPALETALIWMQDMGSDTVGIMPPPRTGRYVPIPVEVEALFITSFAEHPDEAVDFLTYLRTPERMEAQFKQTGSIPPDDRFDLDMIDDPVVRSYVEMAFEGIETETRQVESLLPWGIVGDGFIVAFQKLWLDEVTPQEAADIVEAAAESWRELNPETVQIFIDWMAE